MDKECPFVLKYRGYGTELASVNVNIMSIVIS